MKKQKAEKFEGQIGVYVCRDWFCPECEQANKWSDTVEEDGSTFVLTCDSCGKSFLCTEDNFDSESL